MSQTYPRSFLTLAVGDRSRCRGEVLHRGDGLAHLIMPPTTITEATIRHWVIVPMCSAPISSFLHFSTIDGRSELARDFEFPAMRRSRENN